MPHDDRRRDPVRHTGRPRLLPAPAQRRRRAGIALMLIGLATALRAQAAEEGLQLRGGDGAWTDAVVLETAVDYRIRGLVAEVRVHQTYRNDSSTWVEGRYLLPLPEDAAVGALTVHVGERVIEGEIREKAEAEAMYAAAAASGRAAGLVEQNRPNLFRTAVANIAPGEVVDLEVGYWQPVRVEDGVFSVALPLTLTPRYAPAVACGEDCADAESLPAAAASAGLGNADPPTASIDVDLDAGLPLARVWSATHAVTATREAGAAWHVALADEVVAGDRAFELRWQPEPSRTVRRATFTETVDGEHYALALLVPPTLPVPPVPRELILVIDNSGSMHGESMRQAIAALDRALSRLRPDDTFNVVRFDDSSERLFPKAVPADAAYVAEARAFVRGLEADGGTEMAPALALAFEGEPAGGRLRQVVIATDAAVGNEQALLQAIAAHRGQARLFPVGIGSAPNAWFLRKAAAIGRGSAVLVRDVAELETRMDRLLDRLGAPALRDIRIDWPAGSEAYPAQVPDLYAGEPLQVVARVPALPARAAFEGVTARGRWQDALLLDVQRADATGVGRLWGRARIEALEDARRAGADEAGVRAETVAVALAHGLVSRYTSLVAVERTPSRPGDAPLESVRAANAVPDGSLAFAQGATDARLLSAIALLLAVAATACRRARR
ncbi:marine proteobacterial sortase target protein [Coralloluteibacterium stylophorae]|uniref:Marine proteobacterial sortase target protein n=1 Tax=Coralloluteibacterium stylophorae TaxID=1776034 RepID=A0A8J8AWX7_9GAMM|nr:marine proteobacterial sortase target protein [Coralloluteibacterium stylophorae]MBS7457864.1 marine proteobacterial sortase target protein [Coralloluteibacterium stylophorae]